MSLVFFLLPFLLPIIVHLFGFTIIRKYYISNIAFLKKAFFVTKSPNRIHKILLLCTRLAFLTALVIGFLNGTKILMNVNNLLNINHSIVDNSNSVCAIKNNNQYYEALKLIENGNEGIARLGDKEKSCSNFSMNLSQLLIQDRRIGLTIFSDFQKSFLNKKDGINKDVKYRFVQLEPNNEEPNVSIDSLWLETNYVRKDHSSKISILIRNNSSYENNNVLLDFRVGGKSVASRTEAFGKGAVRKLQFDIEIKTKEDRFCEIRIDDGSWNFDNVFSFVLATTDEVPILVIKDKDEIDNPLCLAYALESIFKCESTTDFSHAQDLNKKSLVIYNQYKTPINTNFTSLLEFAISGGNAWVIPSNNFSIKEVELINKAVGKRVVELVKDEHEEIESPDLNNPFYQNIFEMKPSFNNMPLISPVLKILEGDAQILKTKNGNLALASFQVGKGRIYLSSFPIGADETFSRNSIFLPISYRIAEKSIANVVKPYYRISDGFMEFLPKEKNANKDVIYSMENGGYKIIPEQKIEGDRVKIFLPKQDLPLGFWSVKNNEGLEIFQFGLNNDKKESEVEFYTIGELKEQFKQYSNVEILSFSELKNGLGKSSNSNGSWSLWRYFIVISFLFLLSEILVARYYKGLVSA